MTQGPLKHPIPNTGPLGQGQFTPNLDRYRAAPEYGERVSNIRVRTIDLSTARDNEEIEIIGDFLWAVKSASGGNCDIRYSEIFNDPIYFEAGTRVSGIKYNSLFITNSAQSGATITLFSMVTNNPVVDITNSLAVSLSSSSVTSITGTVTTEEAIADTLDSAADVSVNSATATSILAANTSRVEAIITNPESPGGTAIRIGDSGVGAANGIILQPQGVLILTTTAQVYAYHAKGSAISIPVTEIERS